MQLFMAHREKPQPTAWPSEVWLERFHAGAHDVLLACYQEHFETVDRAVGALLRDADRETVVHEVFYRLCASAKLRQNFRGGTLGAWLTTVARNEALDYLRRWQRERLVESPAGLAPAPIAKGEEDAAAGRLLVLRFRNEWLPPKWRAVFDVRFVEQLDQAQAAARLGMGRSRLAYQEHQIRRLFRRFTVRGELEYERIRNR